MTLRYVLSGKYKYEPFAADQTVLTQNKPVMLIWDLDHDSFRDRVRDVHLFLNTYKPKHLLVSGTCESTCPGVQELVKELLINSMS